MASGIATARHELGHHFLARHFGFEPGDVNLNRKGAAIYIGATAAVDTARVTTSLSEVERYCEDRIQVLYAGCMAEAIDNGAVDNKKAVDLIKGDSGFVDMMMAQQLWSILRNIRHMGGTRAAAQTAIEADEVPIWNAALGLVNQFAASIEAIAPDVLQAPSLQMTKAMLDAHPEVKKHFP